jgi:hypothetical protein
MLETENKLISPEYIAEYYLKIIDDTYRQGYPIILYSHPEKFGLMADYVFQEINKKIENMNLWKTSLTHFANWWLKRDKINYSVEYNPSTKKTSIKGDMDSSVSVKEI